METRRRQQGPSQWLPCQRAGPKPVDHQNGYTTDEDRSCIRVGNGSAMMACLRNFAIALARLRGFTNIASVLRAFAHQPRRALAAVGV